MKKQFVIRCDMEGASGIVSYEQAEPGKSEYAEGRRLFMSDLSALVRGLHDGGAEEILVYDEHFFGRNVVMDEIPDYVQVICGKPNYTAASAGGLDENTAGLILLGFHSKAGTVNALLQHSYESDIGDIRLNGISVGEIGVEAAVAGSFGVPLVLYVGDSAGAAEASALCPDVKCVSVKESMSEGGALCYPCRLTAKRIYAAAYRLASGLSEGTAKPSVLSLGKAELNVILRDTPYAKKYHALYGSEPIQAENANLCWVEYLNRKAEVNKSL